MSRSSKSVSPHGIVRLFTFCSEMRYCKLGVFRTGFIFAKLRIYMRSFVQIIPSRNGEILLPFSFCCSSRIFIVANMSSNAIREDKDITKMSELTVKESLKA